MKSRDNINVVSTSTSLEHSLIILLQYSLFAGAESRVCGVLLNKPLARIPEQIICVWHLILCILDSLALRCYTNGNSSWSSNFDTQSVKRWRNWKFGEIEPP